MDESSDQVDHQNDQQTHRNSNESETKQDENHESIDSSPELQKLLQMFQSKPADVDIGLEIHNAQVLRTIVSLLLSAETIDNDANNTQDAIPNFLKYFIDYLESKRDDFDISISMAYGIECFIQKLYSKSTVGSLVRICEIFMTSEEGLVKEAALKLISNLLECLDEDDMEEHFVNVIYKIYGNEWWRCSGIDLMAISYQKVSEKHKEEFRNTFKGLINDDSTLAKGAMARNYAKIIQHYERTVVETECIEMLELMTSDIQVSVRLHAVETALIIAHMLDEDLIDKHICTIFEKLVSDQSWKIRLEVASQIVNIQKVVKPKLARILLITLLRNLCNDLEAVVRRCLAKNIAKVLIVFKETTDIDLDDLFEIINELNKDTNDDVKNALLGCIMDCTTVLSKEECKKYLLPLMKNTIMCQSISGIQKIEEQCVYNINKLITILGYTVLQEDIEKFLFDILSSESKWRTRRRLIMTINILALSSDEEYFTKSCLLFYKKLLNDHCYAVRRIVPMILPVLIGKFGFEWGKVNILNWIFSFHNHPAYFQRLIVLYAIEELVNPSLLQIKKSTQTQKVLLNSEKDKEYLYKVYSLNEMLIFKLDRLELNNNIEQTAAIRSDLEYYGEDIVDEFSSFDVPSMDVLELLQFLMKYVLPIFSDYIHDKVINVANRAMNTYKLIVDFHVQLTMEFQSDQFKDMFKDFTKERTQSIESNLLVELTENEGNMEKKIEHDIRGKEFDSNFRFEDAKSTTSSDLNDPNEHLNMNLSYSFDYEDGNNACDKKKLLDVDDRYDCLDFYPLNSIPSHVDVNSIDETDTKAESVVNNNEDESVDSKTDNATKNIVNDNEKEGTTLLDEINAKLLEDKTVLEFCKDSTSDAIDV